MSPPPSRGVSTPCPRRSLRAKKLSAMEESLEGLRGDMVFCGTLGIASLIAWKFLHPPKCYLGVYYIGGVFFGVSSFGRFGRRGKNPNLSQGVFTYTPSVTLSLQESVIASPATLERRHHPFDAQRAAAETL